MRTSSGWRRWVCYAVLPIYIYFYLRRKEGRKGIRKRQRPGLIALVDRSQAGVEAPFHHLQSDRAGIDVYDLVDG